MARQISGPDFICIGAQKAGTGWLYEQLRSHPDFWMPPLKEVHYFDRLRSDREATFVKADDRVEAARRTARDERDHRFLDTIVDLCARPGIDLDLYARLFESKDAALSGDITPGYSTLPREIVRQVTEFFPDTRIVFIARDPVERAWSQLSMWVRHGIIEPFDESDLESVTRYLQLPGVSTRSCPSKIVGTWRAHVRPDAFGIYFFDDLQANPAAVRRDLITFIGGDPAKPSGDLAADHNPKAIKEKLPLPDSTRAHLARFFEGELKVCAMELGGPAVRWPGRYGVGN